LNGRGNERSGSGWAGDYRRNRSKTGACKAVLSKTVGGWSDQIIASAQQFEESGKRVGGLRENASGIAIADTVRPEAARTITRLKQLGIQEIVM